MIVMKFGGTSMGSLESIKNVANIVKGVKSKSPVVVVSAMSGVTDMLIDSAHEALRGKTKKIAKNLETVKSRHFEVLSHYGKEEGQAFWDANLAPLFERIEKLIAGLAMLKELSPRSLDLMSSFGERLSSHLLVFVLNQMGLKSERFDTRDILRTDSNYGDAKVNFKVSGQMYRRRILPLVKSGGVPVLTGFIGSDGQGNTTTLGRGGSDYSASIAGILLGADSVEIWTDVDGILTANPRDISGTKLWKNVSFQEAAELAYSGAKVLHPKTIHPAIEKGIDVLVKNTFNPKAAGTTINDKKTDGLKGVTTTKNVSVVYICSDKMLDEFGFVAKVSGIFAGHGLSVDVITTSEVTISISVNGKVPKELVSELGQFGNITVETGQAKLCLVGTNVCSNPKFLAEVFGSIAGYKIHMISFGASNINLTLIIDEKDVKEIASKLHKQLFS